MHPTEIPQSIVERVIARKGRPHVVERLEATNTALIVVDMQDYFVKPGQAACCNQARGIVPNINRLAHSMREAGGTVVWIQTEALPEAQKDWGCLYELYSLERQHRRYADLSPAGSGYRLWSELNVDPKDQVVIKHRYSAFIQGSSNLEGMLRERGIDTLLIAGVATNVCCESTARDGMMLGFRTVMVSDANAALSDDEHIGSLVTFYLYFGDVLSTQECTLRLKRPTDAVSRSDAGGQHA